MLIGQGSEMLDHTRLTDYWGSNRVEARNVSGPLTGLMDRDSLLEVRMARARKVASHDFTCKVLAYPLGA